MVPAHVIAVHASEVAALERDLTWRAERMAAQADLIARQCADLDMLRRELARATEIIDRLQEG